jgi:hypothetical protein
MAATDGDACEWTAQVLSADGGAYRWPYGARALTAERKRVQEIESLRWRFTYGYHRGGGHDVRPNLFTFPMSFEEAFVHSDAERIAMMDRVRAYYNFNWKRDATADAHPRLGNQFTAGEQEHFKQQFRAMKNVADQLFAKHIDDVLLLQGLTEELMPETLELAKRCTSSAELLRCMLNGKA